MVRKIGATGRMLFFLRAEFLQMSRDVRYSVESVKPMDQRLGNFQDRKFHPGRFGSGTDCSEVLASPGSHPLSGRSLAVLSTSRDMLYLRTVFAKGKYGLSIRAISIQALQDKGVNSKAITTVRREQIHRTAGITRTSPDQTVAQSPVISGLLRAQNLVSVPKL